MSARIIDGKSIAAELRGRIAQATASLTAAHKVTPCIAVVLVGDDPASTVYVRSKAKAVAEAGMRTFDRKLPAATNEAELRAVIAELNADRAVSGILVQLPLPPQIDAHRIISSIDPAKDVDGFHPINVGRLASGLPALVPCTPLGCVMLAKTVHTSLAGFDAVVVGRSNIVGKPVAQLLLAENCTVTIAHSKTRDLPAVCRRADLLVAAIGRPETVRGDWIKPGATVIDVGINRVAGEAGKPKLVGDVAYDEAAAVAGAITPVPGGVGPMTIACLLLNTLRATCAQNGLAEPAI
ncbi:MAG TPA: bifunctional methylenetetrahydrofolate dehydrogenase/methenyltetrahydrofolate cyclohydrolase FolD [Pseudolabrys sp.]|uniref:bifunctional methylenetetrahydrofolate dehydrogenase/methenyltetrahydrofolate cyclohydrolase FolD n=1 Tax=Pseudolabrys sp. TaxID=1960880 RepID=UPI002DDCB9FC|nr:bifunctional methylenetetrahydrofolate dehydrogenase/methenyltetrahydrofolate cyclohydrolase FolD [Pseudolabrys sp.]HEV2629975.1 bifunctional methylenetetrahydrofolate dehydrogenase/methenyltetrahydrofolate cyclohydrolase FolD [Pseudolabrys sp.]